MITKNTKKIQLEASWLAELENEFQQPYMTKLKSFLLEEKSKGKKIFPSGKEMFKALIEATAFGCLKIINQIEKHKIKINEIIAIGGLTKSSLIMQVYADITGRKIKTLKSDQVCAVGAGILASIPKNNTISNNLNYFQKKCQ